MNFFSTQFDIAKFYNEISNSIIEKNDLKEYNLVLYKDFKFKKQILLNPNYFFGKSVLIIGDVSTGKTQLTTTLYLYFKRFFNIEEKILPSIFAEYGFESNCIVIDCAPNAFFRNGIKIGGKMQEFLNNFEYKDSKNIINEFKGYYNIEDIIPPRSKAKNRNELESFIKENYEKIYPIFHNLYNLLTQMYKNKNINALDYKNPNNIPIFIFINDISLFFHYKEYDKKNLIYKILNIVNRQKNITFIVNSYLKKEGKQIFIADFGTNVGKREEKSIKRLIKHFKIKIFLI
ncbi:MAG: hypothetical protein ACTSRZ_06115 [Promethearchaeota archaeon]